MDLTPTHARQKSPQTGVVPRSRLRRTLFHSLTRVLRPSASELTMRMGSSDTCRSERRSKGVTGFLFLSEVPMPRDTQSSDRVTPTSLLSG